MRISHMNVARLSALSLLCSIAALDGAAAAPKDGQKFGDWVAQCDKEKPTSCLVKQTQVVEGGARLFEMSIGYFGANPEIVAAVVVPLGTHIPAGVALVVDGKQLQLPILRCLQIGCQAALQLDNATIDLLKKSKTIVLAMVDDFSRQTYTMNISPTGLSAGLTALK